MKFRKEVDVPLSRHPISLDDKIGVFGSCFAWEVADALEQDLYSVWRSPFGISYNPLSMAEQIDRLCDARQIEEADLFEHNDVWHSYAHHGSYSSPQREEALRQMQEDFETAVRRLRETRLFIFTWGTAYYYRLKENDEVVNNCHKLPAQAFTRERMGSTQIVEQWGLQLDRLKALVPNARFLFTISPVPHYSDGIHEHTVSKAILHCALDELTHRHEDIEYFAAYEIMREELRDYRFYKEDLAHPTPQAVAFIMEKFMSSYTDKQDDPILKKWRQLRGQLSHRPFTTDPDRLRTFYTSLLTAVEELQSLHHHPLLSTEQRRLKDLLSLTK